MEPPVRPAAAKRTPRAPAAPASKRAAAPNPLSAAKPVPAAKTPRTPPVKAVKPAPVKAAKSVPVQTAKTIPVKAAKPAQPVPVRVIAEINGASGRAWRMTSRYAVAYVKDAVLAGELLATEPKHLAKSAMAVYYDRKGKAFAWQVRFDAARWDEVVGRLG